MSSKESRCSSCSSDLIGEIYLSETYDNYCEKCKDQVENPQRNHYLEKVLSKRILTCKNLGCNVRYFKSGDHKDKCPYPMVSCYLCGHKGSTRDYVSHLLKECKVERKTYRYSDSFLVMREKDGNTELTIFPLIKWHGRDQNKRRFEIYNKEDKEDTLCYSVRNIRNTLVLNIPYKSVESREVYNLEYDGDQGY